MQPADELGAGPAEVTMALGPHLQHCRVIIGPDLSDTGRAQGGDGHRPGIIRVVLVRIPRGEQPHPGAELGRHIQHPLTGRHQLLGQQMTHAAGALARSGQAAAHASSRSAWAAEARTRSSPSGSSAAPIATTVCEALCGSTPIITAAIESPSSWEPVKTVAGMPDSRT
jgi:hypothetical protein